MFATVLQELKGYFGRDFLLAAFFPVLLFAGLSLALYLEVTRGLSAALAGWEDLPALTRTGVIAGTAITVIVVASLLYNFQYLIIRLFEGYWPRWLHRLRNRRVELYEKRWKWLAERARVAPEPEASEIWAELLTFYPPPNHLNRMMPTRLGNILRAAEIHPYDRYGIDAAVIWPRLRPLLGPETMALLEDRKTTMAFMLSVALLSALFSLLWCPVLALSSNRWDLFLLCALGWPLAWLCYEGAVQSAVAYGEQLRATFDLHRRDLLRALDRPLPADAEAERREWLRLTRFFYRNLPLPSPAPAPPPSPRGWERVAEALADYLEKPSRPEAASAPEEAL